jgi:hypothetical protein
MISSDAAAALDPAIGFKLPAFFLHRAQLRADGPRQLGIAGVTLAGGAIEKQAKPDCGSKPQRGHFAADLA